MCSRHRLPVKPRSEKVQSKMISREQLGQMANALGGIPILGCLPQSAAKQAGLRYGDIVLLVNGRPTANANDFVEARKLCEGRARVVIFRDGISLAIELKFKKTHTDNYGKGPRREELAAVCQQLSDARTLTETGDPSKKPPLTN